MGKTISVIERFWSKVEKKSFGYKTECWIWTAYRNKYGYGTFSGEAKTPNGYYKGKLAHRWSYEHFVENIKDGFEIDHLCRNRACVNPEHLRQVTHQTNVTEGLIYFKRVQHCPKGHPYEGDNLLIQSKKNGYQFKVCRICRNENKRRYYLKNIIICKQRAKDKYYRTKNGINKEPNTIN